MVKSTARRDRGARMIACGWRSLSGIVGDSGALTEQQEEGDKWAGEGKP